MKLLPCRTFFNYRNARAAYEIQKTDANAECASGGGVDIRQSACEKEVLDNIAKYLGESKKICQDGKNLYDRIVVKKEQPCTDTTVNLMHEYTNTATTKLVEGTQAFIDGVISGKVGDDPKSEGSTKCKDQ